MPQTCLSTFWGMSVQEASGKSLAPILLVTCCLLYNKMPLRSSTAFKAGLGMVLSTKGFLAVPRPWSSVQSSVMPKVRQRKLSRL